jgi:2Fe-2S ferredoxin
MLAALPSSKRQCNDWHVVAFRVTVEPNPGEIEVPEGETIMSAAQGLGYQWPTLCNGQGECRVCVLEVVSGDLSLSPPDEREERAIRSSYGALQRRGRTLRQACRAEVVAEGVTVFKRGVRPVAGASAPSNSEHELPLD